MRAFPPLRPVKYDALVVLAVLLLSAAALWRFPLFPAGAAGPEVVVLAGNEELDRFPLARTERVYTSNGYTLHVSAAAEGVRVASSDCPNRDCVRMGTIRRTGESIICLPAGIVILLTGDAAEAVDAVSGR